MMMINLSFLTFLKRLRLLVIIKLKFFFIYIVDIYNIYNIIKKIFLIYSIVRCIFFIYMILLNNWIYVQYFLDIFLIYFNDELLVDSGFVNTGFPTNQPFSYRASGFGKWYPKPPSGGFTKYLTKHSDDNSPYDGYTFENIYSNNKYFTKYEGEKYYTEYGLRCWINFVNPWTFESARIQHLDGTYIDFNDEKHYCKYILAHRHAVAYNPNRRHVKDYKREYLKYCIEKEEECEITTRDISISNLLNSE